MGGLLLCGVASQAESSRLMLQDTHHYPCRDPVAVTSVSIEQADQHFDAEHHILIAPLTPAQHDTNHMKHENTSY